MLVSVSLEEIEDLLIEYFAHRFGQDTSTFTSVTNVKTRFNFSVRSWAQMADTLSQLDWMRRLHVRLQQGEMSRIPTIGQLANSIWKRVRQVVMAPANVDVVSLKNLSVSNIPVGGKNVAKPKGRKKGKKRASKKPARKR